MWKFLTIIKTSLLQSRFLAVILMKIYDWYRYVTEPQLDTCTICLHYITMHCNTVFSLSPSQHWIGTPTVPEMSHTAGTVDVYPKKCNRFSKETVCTQKTPNFSKTEIVTTHTSVIWPSLYFAFAPAHLFMLCSNVCYTLRCIHHLPKLHAYRLLCYFHNLPFCSYV